MFGRPDVAVRNIAFSDTTGERSSEILVVNLLLFKNGTLLMTDIWNLSFSVSLFFSLCKEVHITFVCCIPYSSMSHIPNFISSSDQDFNCISR